MRSTIKITVRSGARGRWRTPFGTTKPCRGARLITRSSRSIRNRPSSTKKFIDIFVFVPVIFALHNGHPDDRIVYLAKRLVVPFVGARVGQLLHIDQFKRPMQDVQVRLVGKVLRRFLRIHKFNLNTKHARAKESRTDSPKHPHFCHSERSLDYARHDKNSFFAVEIIGFLTFDNDAIGC